MPQKLFYLPNVFDMEAARIVETALRQLPGVKHVDYDPTTSLVTIHWLPPTTWEAIEHKLESLGYPLTVN